MAQEHSLEEATEKPETAINGSGPFRKRMIGTFYI
jgi:hypothetical protein